MSETDENLTEAAVPARRVGNGLVAVALIVPVVSGIALWFVTSFEQSLAVSGACVLISSILVAIDAQRLENAGRTQRKWDAALILFLGMCALWIVVYPYAFYRRRRFGGPNLFVPAIVAALWFPISPMLRPFLAPPGLPSCTSQDVVRLLEKLVRETPVGASARSIDGYREISYDRAQERRTGECIVHTNSGDVVVKFIVHWQDRARGTFEVRIPPADLPSCTSPQVVQLLDSIVRKTPAGAGARSIDGHREVTYDRAEDRRTGQCVLHTQGGDIVIKYIVQWRDREQGRFEVGIVE
jgi:hypothetical protein